LPTPEYSKSVNQPLKGLKLGLAREYFAAGLNSEIEAAVREAVKIYESLGAVVKEVSMPNTKYGIATYYIIAPSEASSNLARYDGVHYGYRTDENQLLAELADEQKRYEAEKNQKKLADLDTPLIRLYRKTRAEGFGSEVKRRIMLGTYTLSAGYYDAYYLKALKVRRLIRGDYDKAFQDVDFVVGPTTPSPAFKLGEKTDDPLSMYLEDLYTVTTNLAGIGGLSLPCGMTKAGLPIGLQMQCRPFDEDRLLRAAHMFQQATDWHTRRTKL
jgi:aspartyl-tRNA(Asn)/glutamyl-tRNA(Gln) amidotransferase subunit A